MFSAAHTPAPAQTKGRGSCLNLLHTAAVPLSFYLLEVGLFFLLPPYSPLPLLTGLLVCLVWGSLCLALPGWAGRLLFAASFFSASAWGVAQYVYYGVFGKLMWLTDLLYASDGAIYFSTMSRNLSPAAWFLSVLLILLCLFLTVCWPKAGPAPRRRRRVCLLAALCAALLMGPVQAALPPAPRHTYDFYRQRGFYSLTVHDLWHNLLQPHLFGDNNRREKELAQVDAYFESRPAHTPNQMTGVFAGKDLVVVLLEAFDDWMISPQETPHLYALQQQGLQFTQFYSPYYGTTRSINTQTCIDTGSYFPTDGRYFYDYLDNSFDHSLAARFAGAGYTAQLFHHNWPDFYRRSELVPALGYRQYNSYVVDAGGDETAAMNDQYLFDNQSMRAQFFRKGPTVNFVVTQAAHLPYLYSDPLSQYAFAQYPQYKGAYSCEEEDCLRAKARLADDMVGRMMQELEAEGKLENTVILVLSDHYPYGYRDKAQLLEFSDHAHDMLQLEQTPCFLWAAGLQPREIEKTLQTADLLPTLLNLFGIPSPYSYLGQDAFDPAYPGYAFFADGSWASGGVLCRIVRTGDQQEQQILQNTSGQPLAPAYLDQMTQKAETFAHISNLILSADYYR